MRVRCHTDVIYAVNTSHRCMSSVFISTHIVYIPTEDQGNIRSKNTYNNYTAFVGPTFSVQHSKALV